MRSGWSNAGPRLPGLQSRPAPSSHLHPLLTAVAVALCQVWGRPFWGGGSEGSGGLLAWQAWGGFWGEEKP